MTGNQQRKIATTLASSQRVEQGMRLLGAYFGVYIAVGFGYPLVTGESVLESFSKRMGWKHDEQPRIDCQSYNDTEDEGKS
jgi:hypothetical protein